MIRTATPKEIISACLRMQYAPTGQLRGITNGDSFVMYDHWTPASVNVHICGSPLQDRELVEEMFVYPFLQCAKKLLIAITPEDNKESLALSKLLGFRETYRILDGWDVGISLVMKEMRKEHCRWLMRKAA